MLSLSFFPDIYSGVACVDAMSNFPMDVRVNRFSRGEAVDYQRPVCSSGTKYNIHSVLLRRAVVPLYFSQTDNKYKFITADNHVM